MIHRRSDTPEFEIKFMQQISALNIKVQILRTKDWNDNRNWWQN